MSMYFSPAKVWIYQEIMKNNYYYFDKNIKFG